MSDLPSKKVDIPAVVSLLFALWVSVWRLQATDWTLYLDRVDFLVFTGLGAGLLLGVSSFRPRWGLFFGGVFTLFMIPLRLGMTMDRGIAWDERLISLAGRLWTSFTQVVTNQPVDDAILFLFSMYLLFWMVSLVAGYRMSRDRKPFMSVAIAGIVLLIIDFNSPFVEHRDRYSAAFVFFCLFLAARIYYLNSQKRWAASRVAVDYEIGYHMGRSAVGVGLLLVLFAWNLPVLFVFFTPGSETRQAVSQSWAEFRDRFSKVVSSLQNPIGYLNDMSADAISLGTGNPASDEIVFSVKPGLLSPDGFRYYWRGHSYDYYNQGAWQSSFSEIEKVSPDDWPLTYDDYAGRLKINFEFTLSAQSMRAVYVPSRPIYISRPVSLIGDQLENSAVDVVSVTASPVLYSGEVYQAEALVSAPTIDELRAVGTNYPDWVTDYYLQIPQDLPENISDLALEITLGQPTAYDKVIAVTSYLRRSIQYREIIAQPPRGMEPIEWFLFDYKAGFCNYYATAEVLMLRSVGIPARLVTGYAQGVLNPNKGVYDVRLKDAHAWPEVYFPGYGWVEFEPTVSQPMTALLQGRSLNGVAGSAQDNLGGGFLRDGLEGDNTDRNLEEDVDIGEGGSAAAARLPAYIRVISVILILSAAGTAYSLVKRRYFPTFHPLQTFPVHLETGLKKRGFYVPDWLTWWANYNRMPLMDRVFIRLEILMRVCKVEMFPGMTASEKIWAFVQKYPDIEIPATILLEQYHLEIFSSRDGSVAIARKAARDIWFNVSRYWVRQTVGL